MTTTEEIPDIDLSSLQIDEVEEKPRTRRTRSDAGQPRGTRRGDGALQTQLLIPWAGITTAVSAALPMTGFVLENRGEPTVKALVDWSADHPKMKAALKTVAKAGPASELVQTFALVMMAVAMETGRIPVDNTLARRLQMTDMFYEFHPDRAPEGYAESRAAAPNTDTPFTAPPGI